MSQSFDALARERAECNRRADTAVNEHLKRATAGAAEQQRWLKPFTNTRKPK